MRTNRVVQIGLLVSDLKDAAGRWAEMLGCEMPEYVSKTFPQERTGMKFRDAPSEGQNYQVAFDFENIQVELIEPAGNGESTWKESLAKDGNCIHHIAFESTDMQADQRAFAARGVETLQEGSFPGGAYAYMDTQEKLGAIIEMLYIDFDTVKRKPGTSDRDSLFEKLDPDSEIEVQLLSWREYEKERGAR